MTLFIFLTIWLWIHEFLILISKTYRREHIKLLIEKDIEITSEINFWIRTIKKLLSK